MAVPPSAVEAARRLPVRLASAEPCPQLRPGAGDEQRQAGGTGRFAELDAKGSLMPLRIAAE
jgi:hypothetical protein